MAETTKKEHKTIGRKKALIFYICVIALPMVNFLIFYVYLNIENILLAFKTYDASTNEFYFSGFGNFVAFFQDFTGEPIFLKYAIPNSLILYAIGLFVSMPVSFLISFYIYKNYFCSKFFRIILLMPGMLTGIAWVIIYKYFVEKSLPAIVEALGGVMQYGLLTNPDTRFFTLVFYGFWLGLAGNLLLYVGTMSGINPSVVEAGRLDGMNDFQEVVHITFPHLYPLLMVGWVTGLMGFFTADASVFAFYYSMAIDRIYTIGYFLQTKVIGVNATQSDYPYAAAAGVMITLIIAPLTLWVKHMLEKYGPSED